MGYIASKKNAALLAGIFLPFLLILFIWSTQKIAQSTVPAPAYPLVFCDYERNSGLKIDVVVQNGRIKATFNAARNYTSVDIDSATTLVYVDAATGDRKTARLLPPPPQSTTPSVVDVAIPEPFASLRIQEGTVSPDGYRVDKFPERDGGSVEDLFGGLNHKKMIISKSGRNIAIGKEESSYNSAVILGWALP